MLENSPNQLNQRGPQEILRRLVVEVALGAVLAATGLVASVNAQTILPSNSPNSSNASGTTVANATNTQSPSAVVAAATSQPDNRYRIGPGDVLDIRIFNRPNLSRDAVRVEGNGMIRMPLIDTEIQAACKTEGELAAEISRGYIKYYKNPQVDVFIKEYHSKQVAVIGAVNEQSRFELQRRIRLLELLTFAKGPTAKAGQTINIVHAPPTLACQNPNEAIEDAATAFVSYKLGETMKGLPASNPFIEPGDIITLPEADQIYVVGNVFTPLTIPLKEPITLSRAVAMAGGVKQDTKKDKIRIVRQEPGTASRREILVDLSAIEKKHADDVALLPNDIVDVPISGSKSFMRSLLGTVAPTVSSLPVRVIP
ncbi:MAG TPA: polysaccharide biosynthesis/export family protein [Pyrinomonadaceae bacterium]|nr:polysaccharide biosynthesis/export family protein [Pyrinomonadaceae bacterium]